ncbi:hypothetical protein [Leptospira noguchii]|uniref:hypothetical protein n=1 Tax=Leptospira noguchii TaxID=28182 RepID=UPI001FB576B1|nr:hypothetical protein [Leptospira noguchii]UOG51091.1 hypothetical protein MAL09_10095 [Leptospira noguchii]
MKRILSIIIIFMFVSCASYSEKVEQNKTDLYRSEQIVRDSNISKKDKDFVIETLKNTKKLLNKGVAESVLADRWRDWVFDKWLYITLFVLGMVTLLVFKFRSFSLTSLIPNFSFRKNGGPENAG